MRPKAKFFKRNCLFSKKSVTFVASNFTPKSSDGRRFKVSFSIILIQYLSKNILIIINDGNKLLLRQFGHFINILYVQTGRIKLDGS